MPSISQAISKIKKLYIQSDESQESKYIEKTLQGFPRNARIVDFGCGQGRILRFLRLQKFTNLYGIELNSHHREFLSHEGFCCAELTADLMSSLPSVDILLMVHVIEHLTAEQILSTIEDLKYPKAILVITPMLTSDFYNDPDHIRPFTPESIDLLLARINPQIKKASAMQYSPKKTYFKRSPFRFRLYSLPKGFSYALNLLFFLAYILSGKMISRATAWMCIYQAET